jgi:hypothetical protein
MKLKNNTRRKKKMIARSMTLIAVLVLFTGFACAQDYPILNMVADRVINKYQSATCEQVWQDKEKPKGEMEKNLIQMLKENPQMRQVFIDKVAATVANKMFECGLVP